MKSDEARVRLASAAAGLGVSSLPRICIRASAASEDSPREDLGLSSTLDTKC